jgi:hypothetical protein
MTFMKSTALDSLRPLAEHATDVSLQSETVPCSKTRLQVNPQHCSRCWPNGLQIRSVIPIDFGTGAADLVVVSLSPPILTVYVEYI